jgi:hypothetical protein
VVDLTVYPTNLLLKDPSAAGSIATIQAQKSSPLKLGDTKACYKTKCPSNAKGKFAPIYNAIPFEGKNYIRTDKERHSLF